MTDKPLVISDNSATIAAFSAFDSIINIDSKGQEISMNKICIPQKGNNEDMSGALKNPDIVSL